MRRVFMLIGRSVFFRRMSPGGLVLFALVLATSASAAIADTVAPLPDAPVPVDETSTLDLDAIRLNQQQILDNQRVILKNQQELEEKYREVERLKAEIDNLKAAPVQRPLVFKPTFFLRIRPDFMHNVKSLGAVVRPDRPGAPVTFEDDDYFYVGSRLMVGLQIEPLPGFRAVVTIQDSRKWGEEANFRSIGNGTLDIFEAYFEFANISGSGVNFRAGRFTMDYGSTMHVNSGGSGATGQTYDGARLSWSKPGLLKIDAFTTLVKTGLGPIFSADTKEDYESFSGVYLATDSPVKWMDAELYGFYLDDAFANFTQRLGTVGGRVIFRPIQGLTITGEAAVQFGQVSSWDADATLRTSDHLASIYLADLMYEFHFAPAKPLIGVKFLYASGDSDPWDQQSRAFKPTFGSTHNFLGYMDVFRAGGIWDIAPTFRLKPVDGLDIWIDYHIFSQTADGGLYQHFSTQSGNGTRNGTWTMDRGLLIPAGNSQFIGHELDVTIFWHPLDWIEVAFAYCYFIPGAALDGASIRGVVERPDLDPIWVEETPLGGLVAHRALVWTTFSY